MGTKITLDVAGLSISYSKNHVGFDHGALFQEEDRTTIPEHDPEQETDPARDGRYADHLYGEALVRPLSAVVSRLRLLGYDLDRAAAEYHATAQEAVAMRESLNEFGHLPERDTEVMSFEAFRAFVADVTISDLNDTFVEGDYGSEERRWRIVGRFDDDAFVGRIPRDVAELYNNSDGWSERSHFGTLVGFLDPYTLLLLFAENPRNHDAPVVWCYGPLVDAGWAGADDPAFVTGVRRHHAVLLATEGSSDVHILRRALALLRPEIADFFRFVDVSDGHPFSGVGGMVRFAEGLVKIDVQNRVLFVLDNDAEGAVGHARIDAMGLPANMRALTLPTLPALSAIPTLGPEGAGMADINGRAAAIECYLDFTAGRAPPPVVRWSNYKREVGVYQGALEMKDAYAKAFHAHAAQPDYDTGKLVAVVDTIVNAAAVIAALLAREM